jgi:hypothetical protein
VYNLQKPRYKFHTQVQTSYPRHRLHTLGRHRLHTQVQISYLPGTDFIPRYNFFTYVLSFITDFTLHTGVLNFITRLKIQLKTLVRNCHHWNLPNGPLSSSSDVALTLVGEPVLHLHVVVHQDGLKQTTILHLTQMAKLIYVRVTKYDHHVWRSS